MKPVSLLVLFILSLHCVLGQSKFSKQEVIHDLEILRKSLVETHYNVYAYTSKATFQSTYEEVKGKIKKDSLTLLETTNLFQQLISVVNNGHTSIDFPIQPYIAYAQSGGTLFPLEIAFEYDKALVRKNWSDDGSIEIGAEVISINGLSMSEVLSKLYPQISAERPYFKHAKIELYSFPRYYWQVFGEQDDFTVEIRSNGVIKSYSLNAISLMEGYEAKRTEVLNSTMQLEFLDSSAYLNPGGFGGDKKKYRAFIDSAFVQINNKKSKNLILDLRNNPGGDDAFSDYMVSYIADRPFKWNSSFTLKTSKFLKEHIRKNNDTTQVFWKKALAHKDGEIYDYNFDAYRPQPAARRFSGKVYVLVNRQSHSQSAVTASQIQDYGFGTIVGEETGDYPSLYASIFQFPLPNTNIIVNVSKGYMVRVNGSKKEAGVVPDIFIKDHLLDEKDEILSGLLERINKS